MEDSIFLIITEEESKLPFILKSIGLQNDQEHMNRPEGHPDYHWLHCTRGEGRLLLETGEYDIRTGDGFFFCPGVPHEYYATKRPWETHWITFNGWASEGLIEKFCLGRSKVYSDLDIARIDLLLDEIYIHAQHTIPFSNYECSHLVYKFIIELKYCATISSFGATGTLLTKLQPIIDFIGRNYDKTPSLEDMAAVIQVTPRHLCRIFKQALRMSPFDYLTAYRIKRAKEILISSPGLTVNEIAEKAGYRNTSYFCSVFKACENLTPLEFRRINSFTK